MIQILKADKRGFSQYGWLESKHSFSFANFHNAQQMGFSVLRVINEDHILGGTGFDTHGHRDMEIISYVVSGALEHKDSMGNSTVIRPGDIQRMSAGTGIKHSEYNHLKDTRAHFLQIWILPEAKDIQPSYNQKNFSNELKASAPILVASRHGKKNSITLNQDVDIYACKSTISGEHTIESKGGHNFWIQIIKGKIEVLGQDLLNGDGAAIREMPSITLKWDRDSEFLIFDLP